MLDRQMVFLGSAADAGNYLPVVGPTLNTPHSVKRRRPRRRSRSYQRLVRPVQQRHIIRMLIVGFADDARLAVR
jgi:hypothetical protein